MEHTHGLKTATIKLLAIVGFFAVAGLIVWALVQGVRTFPHAFSSLATIAESVTTYQAERELEISLDKNIVNSGETFKIFWTEMRGNGAYHFGYSCVDSAQVSVRTGDGSFQSMSCTEDLELSKEATGLFIMATSRSQRFSTLTFTIRFDSENGDDHITESRVTIVNATVPTAQVPSQEETVQEEIENTNTEIPVAQPTTETEPIVTEQLPPEPVATVPPPIVDEPARPVVPTQPASAIVSILPQTSVSAFTDLKMSFSAVGTMSGNTFTPSAAFTMGSRAGLRFTVTNIGTKRSDIWSFVIDLPEGRYESGSQTPLEPGEQALYTVGFDFPESDIKSFTLKGTVDEKKDMNTKNNSFSWSVKIAK